MPSTCCSETFRTSCDPLWHDSAWRWNGCDHAAPEMTAHLNRIEREAEKLNQLIGQLLKLSSMEAAEKRENFQPVSLKTLIDEILPDAEYEAQQRRSVISFAAEEDCAIAGNRELLDRAIENVVRNAVRYTEPGSAVEIRLDCSPIEGHRTAVLEISDHGPGIPTATSTIFFAPSTGSIGRGARKPADSE